MKIRPSPAVLVWCADAGVSDQPVLTSIVSNLPRTFTRMDGKFQPVGHPMAQHDAAHMVTHGVGAKPQAQRNGLVAQTMGQQNQHVGFTTGTLNQNFSSTTEPLFL
jgi:hypothetical protein